MERGRARSLAVAVRRRFAPFRRRRRDERRARHVHDHLRRRDDATRLADGPSRRDGDRDAHGRRRRGLARGGDAARRGREDAGAAGQQAVPSRSGAEFRLSRTRQLRHRHGVQREVLPALARGEADGVATRPAHLRQGLPPPLRRAAREPSPGHGSHEPRRHGGGRALARHRDGGALLPLFARGDASAREGAERRGADRFARWPVPERQALRRRGDAVALRRGGRQPRPLRALVGGDRHPAAVAASRDEGAGAHARGRGRAAVRAEVRRVRATCGQRLDSRAEAVPAARVRVRDAGGRHGNEACARRAGHAPRGEPLRRVFPVRTRRGLHSLPRRRARLRARGRQLGGGGRLLVLPSAGRGRLLLHPHALPAALRRLRAPHRDGRTHRGVLRHPAARAPRAVGESRPLRAGRDGHGRRRARRLVLPRVRLLGEGRPDGEDARGAHPHGRGPRGGARGLRTREHARATDVRQGEGPREGGPLPPRAAVLHRRHRAGEDRRDREDARAVAHPLFGLPEGRVRQGVSRPSAAASRVRHGRGAAGVPRSRAREGTPRLALHEPHLVVRPSARAVLHCRRRGAALAWLRRQALPRAVREERRLDDHLLASRRAGGEPKDGEGVHGGLPSGPALPGPVRRAAMALGLQPRLAFPHRLHGGSPRDERGR